MPTSAIAPSGPSAAAPVSIPLQYLSFGLGKESYAIPIEHVREIIEFEGLTTIPMTPPFLRGVINLRGSVVPVIDLQARFGRGETSIAKRTCVVIVEISHDGSSHQLGTLVDTVNEVLTAEPSQIEKKPSFGTGLRQDFVSGILNRDGRFVVILDAEQILSVEELATLVASVEG